MDKINSLLSLPKSLNLVPIRSLGPRHRARIAKHLLALDEADRYLRFGYYATDEQINKYVADLNFKRDDIYGIYNRKLELIAMAHVAVSAEVDSFEQLSKSPSIPTSPGAPTTMGPKVKSSHAEFGVSVLKDNRGRGYGARLFDRAITHARNEGRDTMYIHALTENTVMLKIARKAGATVERSGTESDAYLKLPEATLATRLTEMVEDQMAELDYGFKQQAKHVQELMTEFQNLKNLDENIAQDLDVTAKEIKLGQAVTEKKGKTRNKRRNPLS
jgi:RimJ/RimL family protein N-acetyltransferase